MLKRRTFIALCGSLASGLIVAGQPWRSAVSYARTSDLSVRSPLSKQDSKTRRTGSIVQISDRHPDNIVVDNITTAQSPPIVQKSADVILSKEQNGTLAVLLARLSRLQSYVGYGNFNVISWDRALLISSKQGQIGKFTKDELQFIETIFFADASSLGFYGDKVITGLSAPIIKKDIVKIPGTGHYLFKGDAFNTFQKIRKDIGKSIVLTSGIRSVVKQTYLFLNKAAKVNGNLSLASYSLAPPGHSYHAVGDFDVGKINFGRKNFTEEFALTDEFKRLSDFGYLNIRYPQNNPYGVRYEPWHIKVV